MKNTTKGMMYPKPGDRCGFRLHGRIVNGTVVKTIISVTRITHVVRVSKKYWKTRKTLYTVPRSKLIGWTNDL